MEENNIKLKSKLEDSAVSNTNNQMELVLQEKHLKKGHIGLGTKCSQPETFKSDGQEKEEEERITAFSSLSSATGAQTSRKKRNRTPFSLPPLGQPGAVDDSLAPAVTEGPVTDQRAERLSPKADINCSKVVPIKVAVMPRCFPKEMLSTEESLTLEGAIIDEMALGWEYPLQFEGRYFWAGMLVVICASLQSADWLMKKASSLKTWKGLELVACLGQNIPKMYMISSYFKKSTEKDIDLILALINAQNEGLFTETWKILNCVQENSSLYLTFGINDQVFHVIKKNKYYIKYRFGNKRFHSKRVTKGIKAEKKKETSVTTSRSTTFLAQQTPRRVTKKMPLRRDLGDLEDIDLSALNVSDPEGNFLGQEEEKLLSDEVEFSAAPRHHNS